MINRPASFASPHHTKPNVSFLMPTYPGNRTIALLFGLSLLMLGGCFGDQIRLDEVVTFFPTAACRTPDNQQWVIPIHGWIYEPETDSLKRKLLIEWMADALDLEPRDRATAIFRQRIRRFLVDNDEGKNVSVRIGPYDFHVGRSGDNGHFSGKLRLFDHQVRSLGASVLQRNGRLRFHAILNQHDQRSFVGEVHLIEPEGISVISDIDDTLKWTHVTDKEEMLENTFLKTFQAIDGIAGVYQRWSKAGVKFHYVSGSPWQLYEDLADFFQRSGFPSGTFHLKDMDSSAGLLSFSGSTRELKMLVIDQLFMQYPHRRFILVGDSGENDPEIYAEFARRYPHQVLHIFIHELEGKERNARRYRKAMRNVPDSNWSLFTSANELRAYQLPR